MNRTLVTILTWNKLKLLKGTIRLFTKYNPNCDILVYNNGSIDKTQKYLVQHNYDFISGKKNIGIFMATRILWLKALNRGYDFILNLQNDFPCLRPIPFDDMYRVFDEYDEAGFVRLNNKNKMVKISKKQRRIISKPRRFNLVTNKKLKYGKWFKVGQTSFRFHNYHFSFNPNLFRTSLVKSLVGKIVKKRERQIMEKFERSGLAAVQVRRKYFETVIRARNAGWIH